MCKTAARAVVMSGGAGDLTRIVTFLIGSKDGMNKFVEGRPRGSLAVGNGDDDDDESGSDVCSVHRLPVFRRSTVIIR